MDFSTADNTDSPQPRMTSTATMETFPVFNNKTILTMSDEDFQTVATTYIRKTLDVLDLYPEESKKVNELMDQAKKNREDMEKEEMAAPKKGVVLISDKDHAQFVKKLKHNKEVKHRFDGDQFNTKIRMVDGVMTAFDPPHPDGRAVWSTAEYKQKLVEKPAGSPEFRMMSPKMVLRECYGSDETDENCPTDVLYYKIIRSLPQGPIYNKFIEIKLHLTGVMCLLAKKYEIEFASINKDAFSFKCNKDVKKEHLRELIVLLSALS